MDAVVANTLVVLSEVILSAYPLLIKLVDASVFFQTGLRMFVFTAMAVLGAIASKQPIEFTKLLSGEGLAVGVLNLIHVFGSYIGFERLAAGNAMALFYTYPIFNILGASAILGERFDMEALPWMLLAVCGAVLVAQPTGHDWDPIGIVAVLIAALTEVGIYLWFKTHKGSAEKEPWEKMTTMYGSSGLLWLFGAAFALLMGPNLFNITGGGLSAILLFNAIVGFGGYALRFYMIPRVSTVVFSALSFFGIISAYVFGWLGAAEMPTVKQIMGALAIIIANIRLIQNE